MLVSISAHSVPSSNGHKRWEDSATGRKEHPRSAGQSVPTCWSDAF